MSKCKSCREEVVEGENCDVCGLFMRTMGVGISAELERQRRMTEALRKWHKADADKAWASRVCEQERRATKSVQKVLDGMPGSLDYCWSRVGRDD